MKWNEKKWGGHDMIYTDVTPKLMVCSFTFKIKILPLIIKYVLLFIYFFTYIILLPLEIK